MSLCFLSVTYSNVVDIPSCVHSFQMNGLRSKSKLVSDESINQIKKRYRSGYYNEPQRLVRRKQRHNVVDTEAIETDSIDSSSVENEFVDSEDKDSDSSNLAEEDDDQYEIDSFIAPEDNICFDGDDQSTDDEFDTFDAGEYLYRDQKGKVRFDISKHLTQRKRIILDEEDDDEDEDDDDEGVTVKELTPKNPPVVEVPTKPLFNLARSITRETIEKSPFTEETQKLLMAVSNDVTTSSESTWLNKVMEIIAYYKFNQTIRMDKKTTLTINQKKLWGHIKNITDNNEVL